MRSAMPGEREQLRPLAAAERVTVATDEQRRVVRRAAWRPRGRRARSCRRRPSATPRCRRPSASSTRRVGATLARRREDRAVDQRARSSRRGTRRGSARRAICCSSATLAPRTGVAADSSASRRGSGKCSTVRTSSTLAPSTSSISRTSRSSAIDARAARTANSSTATLVALLEDVDADDVAVDGTDARRDETERTGTVGEPDPHEDVERAQASLTDRATGRQMTRSVSPGGEDTARTRRLPP